MFSPDMLGLNLLKIKKTKAVFNGFNQIVNQTNRKPNRFWIDLARKFYNSPMQKWSNDNDILMYTTHNEGNLTVAERFIKTLRVKSIKHDC